jgi:glycosyltransferase involved in cell wall biosynthesis
MITVLMPVYNAAPYLREAIDSVLNQTYKDFEFLIINDGSTDDTPKILESYTDQRIRIIHQDNIKLIKTLNKGLNLAKGIWIARFDADDICYPDRLENQLKFLEEHPDHIVVGGDADYMDKEGNYLFTFKINVYNDTEIKDTEFRICPFIHSSTMYLKEAVIKAGAYNENAISFEDHLLWRDLSPFGKMANLQKTLIRVRFSPESVTMDEKWRGTEFKEIKQRSVKNGFITEEDAIRIKEILKTQDVKRYQQASYNSLVAKKYLWNQHDPKKARIHLKKAISAFPRRIEPYMLYILSFLPKRIINGIYNSVKK